MASMSEELTALGLVADLRKALGDPLGRLMQDELVAHAAALVAERDRLRADVQDLVECLDGAYALAIGHAATYKFNHGLEEVHPTHAAILDSARALPAKHKETK